MDTNRRKVVKSNFDRRWLLAGLVFIALFVATINCTLCNEYLPSSTAGSEQSQAETDSVGLENEFLEQQPLSADTVFFSDELWAEVTEGITTPWPSTTCPTTGTSTISLDVRNANLLDVLTLLAYKLNMNIIFLEEPSEITIKTERLSPLTTFQIVLQKEGYDYLTIGCNYIVGQRERLYSDFTNRMLLTRYSLFYVSPTAMEGYLTELGMPLQSLAVDSNGKAIWLQGTPMALGKARELINTLDVMENAAFAEGGARKIRMPVATATGGRAEEELEALIDLLSILLDGFRDGRTDMGWVTWDHPDPIPYIYMDWDNPIIKPYDIKMKITRDFAGDYTSQIRYLIAEGSPANIDLVNQMISAIAGTPSSPITFGAVADEPVDNSGGDTVQWIPNAITQQQSVARQSYSVAVSAVPQQGGNLSGGGSFTEGSSVTVTASPATDYEFVRWIENGAELSTGGSYTFNIYSNRSLEAVFVKKAEPDTSENSTGSTEAVPE